MKKKKNYIDIKNEMQINFSCLSVSTLWNLYSKFLSSLQSLLYNLYAALCDISYHCNSSVIYDTGSKKQASRSILAPSFLHIVPRESNILCVSLFKVVNKIIYVQELGKFIIYQDMLRIRYQEVFQQIIITLVKL